MSTIKANKGSIQTESGHIMSTIKANKVGLSSSLDATMKEGHDMKVFGFGTLAKTMSDKDTYGSFVTSLHAIYTEMEAGMDEVVKAGGGGVEGVWSEYGEILRREPGIRKDLADVGVAVPKTWEVRGRSNEERGAKFEVDQKANPKTTVGVPSASLPHHRTLSLIRFSRFT
jgi:hypothetical protein